jgi:DNA adenine methylase
VTTPQTSRATLLNEWYGQIGSARPFLKWVGGKQNFIARFSKCLPAITGRYFEPFLGGASVFFYVQRATGHPIDAVLSDVNVPLIRTYKAVQADPEGLYQRLSELQQAYLDADSASAFYYELRARYNATLPHPDPADFVFINRTCWNGLYRLNRKGLFNTPYGRPKNEIVIPSREDLINASAALVRARLRATSWENAIAQAQPGDFVFLDPPYYSDIEKDDTKYKARRFDLHEHTKLAGRLTDLAARGVDFVLTNSGEPEMIELYTSFGLSVHGIKMPRAISGKTDQRFPVDELIVTPKVAYESPLATARSALFRELQAVG